MHYQQLKTAWAELTAPGMPFEVGQVEVRGQRLRTFVNAPPTVREVWLAAAAQFGEREYLVYGEKRLTYAEAHRRVTAVAAWLHGQGVRPRDRVAIALRNYPEWLLIYWACAVSGVTVVGMNAWWVAEEMAMGLADARPRVLFADAERLERLFSRPEAAEGVTVVGVRAELRPGVVPWAEVIATEGAIPAADVDPDDDACIFYTSGTTGFPKGAQLTHRGCVNNLMNMVFAGQVFALATNRATGVEVDPAAPPPVPVTLATTPLFHVTANNCLAYAATAAGGKIVLMHKWDAGEALRLIERERVTSMSGVPVMAREVLHHPDFATRDTSSLMTLGGGGAQVPPDLVGKIDEKVATARPNTGYGMTETCGIITSISGDFFVDRPDSAGPAMPTFETRVVDEGGTDVEPGGVGELWVRGAGVIKGYINRPDATAETITDGWLHTGDIARIDSDGFIYVVDRKKDMVLRGGENVYCAEVEAALYRHPAVAEACVFGVPDERLGEEVAAAVVLHPGEQADGAALRSHLAEVLARHKVPRYLWFRTEALPRNASGKFLRKDLRAALSLQDAA